MRKMAITACLIACTLCMGMTVAHAENETDARIAQIQQQVEDLQRQLAELKQAQTAASAPEGDLDSVKADVQQLKDVVNEPEGAVQTAISDVNKIKKIKVSGYVQARYEAYQSPDGVADKGDNLAPDNRFYVRRGRFKITGQPTNNALGVVQLDISGFDRGKVESKDLYLEYHPWGIGTIAPFFVRLGQQNVPFGYVIERSSSSREVPERPKIYTGTTVGLPSSPSFSGLFPGERDKGLALISTELSKVDWALGLFNGTGTKSDSAGKSFLEKDAKFEDNNTNKAIVGRVRYSVTENLLLGTSFYRGKQAVRELSNSPSAVMVDQTRWGADVQYYAQGGSIKAEYVTAKEPYYSNTTTTPNAKYGKNRSVSGWYVVGTKSLGEKYQLVAQYDELKDKAIDSTYGKLSTWNLGVIRHLDEATKLKLFYEINKEEKNTKDNNGLRLEVITVF